MDAMACRFLYKSLTMPSVSFLSSALLVLAACAAPKGGKPTAPVKASSPTAGLSHVTDMHLHFEDINAIQNALVSGDLSLTRELAKKMRVGFSGEQPEGWGPFIERSVASAEMLEVTDDLGMATRVSATMAGTCGDCHKALEIRVVQQVIEAPPHEDEAFADFMVQHRWGADRLWEGLIGPSEEAWQAGAAVLATTELSVADVGGGLVVTPEIEALLGQIRMDAKAARTTTGSKERAQLYGSLLAGCANCHRDRR